MGGIVPTIRLKNIPKRLYAALDESAARNNRSLDEEILARLQRMFSVPVFDAREHARVLEALVGKRSRVEHSKVQRYKKLGRP